MFDLRVATRVLGVDPGLSRCGLGVIDGPTHRAALVASDVIRTGADMALGQRLAAIHAGLVAAVNAHRPAALAVERVFINAQARTGVGAMQVVGLVHLIGAGHDLPVWEYTPSQVKAAVTGVGDADKTQVTFMVQRMLSLEAAPRPADRADAMAVALCHLNQWGVTTAGDASGFGSAQSAGRPTGARQPGKDTAGLSPRLAAALANAGPGLGVMKPAATRANDRMPDRPPEDDR
ncbi:MAG TPA: crossover junction endodeoxyribonuclease RuvC [Euzebya sp.]|nr:crossover junction endodeoxyribonuclease RuvC [Euzebya sp.]